MPQNPASVTIDINAWGQLAQLIASHGVYAMVVLFMFYQQRQARLNLKTATTEKDKSYFRKQHTITLYVTIFFSALATGVWGYATFYYKPKLCIEGALKNLREQPTRPIHPGDPPMMVYRLGAFRGDVKFFSFKKPSLSTDTKDTDINWVLLSPTDAKTLELTFQQEYCLLDPIDPQKPMLATLEQAPPTPQPRFREDSPIKTAVIDFENFKSLIGEEIHLIYKRKHQDPPEKFGHLFVDQNGHLTKIPWMDDDEVKPVSKQQTAQVSLFGARAAWAQNLPHDSIFSQDGPPPAVAAKLRNFLESEDLAQQVLARDTLIQGGERSLPLIKDMLAEKSGSLTRQGRLVHNISSTIETIENAGVRVEPSLRIELAQSLYDIGDYKAASQFFDGIPLSNSVTLYQRGVANLGAGRYEDSRNDLQMFISMTKDPRKQSAALTNIGATYSLEGNFDQAEQAHEKALRLDPKNTIALYNLGILKMRSNKLDNAAELLSKVVNAQPNNVAAYINLSVVYQRQGNLTRATEILEGVIGSNPQNPRVLNNLAYLYALQNKNLDKALSYIDQAIRVEGESANYLDTKGWILYKLGNPQQALPYIQKALQKDPNGADKRRHLEEVQKAITAK